MSIDSHFDNKDFDGFPTLKAIQSMTTDDIKREYTSSEIAQKNPSKFLGKVAAAALQEGLDSTQGTKHLSLAVELYLQHFLGDGYLQQPQGEKLNVLRDLFDSSTEYTKTTTDSRPLFRKMVDLTK